jgi:phosphopantothenoylcysteine decarboxylase / phosphopantothenate---cysteine ligase
VLVTGPTCLEHPWGVTTVAVESAREMHEAVLSAFPASSIVIKTAAVADYRPKSRAEAKIKKGAGTFVLDLVKNADILGELGRMKGERLLVGFAAETGGVQEFASGKLADKNLDMVVANNVSQEGAGFNLETNIVRLLFRDGGSEDVPLMLKADLANLLLDRVVKMRKKDVEG